MASFFLSFSQFIKFCTQLSVKRTSLSSERYVIDVSILIKRLQDDWHLVLRVLDAEPLIQNSLISRWYVFILRNSKEKVIFQLQFERLISAILDLYQDACVHGKTKRFLY